MKKLEITTECYGREYSHGHVKEFKGDGFVEMEVTVDLNLVIQHSEMENFRDQIQEVVRRFAL